MTLVATILALIIACIGLVGVLSPPLLLDFLRALRSSGALYVVAAVRIVFGVVLVLAAPASRLPRTLRVLGTIIIVAGLVTPLFGLERTRALLEWWTSQPSWAMRAWASVAVAFGVFLVYALRRRVSA